MSKGSNMRMLPIGEIETFVEEIEEEKVTIPEE
jgi:hypothetical protein